MKFYIPSSTLNLNTFLATETIHAPANYKLRGFGTHRYQEVLPQDYKKGIYLYKAIPDFPLLNENTSQYEQYPMVFEVSIDSDEKYIYPINDDKSVLFRTFYSTPRNTKILFFSEEAKNITIAKAKLVLEVKLLKRYIQNMVVIPLPTEPSSNLGEFSLDLVTGVTEREVIELKARILDREKKTNEFDSFFNAIKGLMYSYLLTFNTKIEDSSEFINYVEGLAGKGVDTTPKYFMLTCILGTILNNRCPYVGKSMDFNIQKAMYEMLEGMIIVSNTQYQKCKNDLEALKSYIEHPVIGEAPPVLENPLLNAFLWFLKKADKIEELEFIVSKSNSKAMKYSLLFYHTYHGFSNMDKTVLKDLSLLGSEELLSEVMDRLYRAVWLKPNCGESFRVR